MGISIYTQGINLMKRSEILNNRRKWINILKDNKTQKLRGRLDAGNGRRCCLGHGCYILDIEKEVTLNALFREKYTVAYGASIAMETAPEEFVEAVGLWDCSGAPFNDAQIEWWNGQLFNDLTAVNDEYLNADGEAIDISPQEIGGYLESVIEGGVNTPFRPLSEFEE